MRINLQTTWSRVLNEISWFKLIRRRMIWLETLRNLFHEKLRRILWSEWSLNRFIWNRMLEQKFLEFHLIKVFQRNNRLISLKWFSMKITWCKVHWKPNSKWNSSMTSTTIQPKIELLLETRWKIPRTWLLKNKLLL